MKFTHEELVNGIVGHRSNSGAILNTSREYLLLLEQELDNVKATKQIKKGITGSEIEVLKEKFDSLYKQVNDVLTNVSIYRNELLLRQKMDSTDNEVSNTEQETPETKKEQFNKDYDDSFNFKDFSQDSKSGDIKGGEEIQKKKEEDKE